jgi:hypothetical protein
MSDSTLLTQLANRAKLWHTTTGVSQSLMAKAINVPDGNYSAFLAGKRGIGARVYLPIAEIGSLTKAGSDSQIQRPVRSGRIQNLQERGQSRMRLDVNDGGGWVPGLSGTDPHDAGTIDDTPDNETLDTLRSLRGVHRKIIRVINDYINEAKVNQGSTPPTDQKFAGRR